MSAAPLQFLLLLFSGWVNRRQDAAIKYLQEENRILREQLGGRKLRFTDDQRRRLAIKARCLARRVLESLDTIVTPNTLLRWYRLYRELIGKKYDGGARRRPGRPRSPNSVRKLVVRFATENSSWGYTRIQGALRNVGHIIGRNTVKRTLREHGLEPAPSRGKRMPWSTFLKAHLGAIGALDFFTDKMLALAGLVRRYLLSVINIATRRAHVEWPPQSPDLTAFAKRFVSSIKSEGLGKIIRLDERRLVRPAVEYVEHCYGDCNHQRPDTRAIIERAMAANSNAPVARRERLGGILSFDYSRAA